MPAQSGIQGNSDSVTPAKAGVQKTNQDANNSNSADTPSNRYAKLQKQSQDADPSSDPGNDPDANNPQNNNQMANNSNGSNNPSRADRWNQDTQKGWTTKWDELLSRKSWQDEAKEEYERQWTQSVTAKGNNNSAMNDFQSDTPFLTGAHIGLGTGGILASVKQFFNVAEGKWQGLNGKWNDLSWGGNGATGPRSNAVNTAEVFEGLAKFLFKIDTLLNIYQGTVATLNGDEARASKAALDTTMGAIGVYGGIPGLAISSTYFVIDQFIGWDNVGAAINTAYQVDQEELNQQLNNMGMK